ncbi:MAG: class III extradiol dioxygenase subunit B-like domain-containing protein [Thermodesulfobacteriota bacterium]
MAICCAALMCHAPIVVPEVGGSEAGACVRTTGAMAALADRVVAHEPDCLVLVSPHAPRERARFGLVGDDGIHGSFARFGRRDAALGLPGAPAAARAAARHAASRGLGCVTRAGGDLDHGSMVPLWFLAAAGWRGATLVVALPGEEDQAGSVEAAMGEALRDAAGELGERWAVVASGDMSHRLAPHAPAGFHPRAREFDRAFVAAVEAGDYRAACRPDPLLRRLAAEDVVASTRVASAAAGFARDLGAVLSYEAPFGVGYLAALLYGDGGGALSAR